MTFDWYLPCIGHQAGIFPELSHSTREVLVKVFTHVSIHSTLVENHRYSRCQIKIKIYFLLSKDDMPKLPS